MPSTVDFDAIMQTFPDRYQVVRANPPAFTILAASDQYLKMVGKTREEIVGRQLFDVFPEDPTTNGGRDDLIASFMHVIEQKEHHEAELLRYDVMNKDGTYETRYWRVTNAPIHDDDGSVIAILNRPEDITELVQLQNKAEAQSGKAASLGRFFFDRAALWGALIFVTYLILGALAWGIVQTNRNSKVQLEQLETVVESTRAQSGQNEALLQELKDSQDLLKDCSTPGGKCFEDQISASSVGAALGAISGTVLVMQECALPIPIDERAPARLAECRQKAEQYRATIIQQARERNNR